MFLGSQVRKLDIEFDPRLWQFEDSEICSVGMIQPSNSRMSGLSGLSGFSGNYTCVCFYNSCPEDVIMLINPFFARAERHGSLPDCRKVRT